MGYLVLRRWRGTLSLWLVTPPTLVLRGVCACLRGLGLFCHFLLTFLLLQANVKELKVHRKDFISQWSIVVNEQGLIKCQNTIIGGMLIAFRRRMRIIPDNDLLRAKHSFAHLSQNNRFHSRMHLKQLHQMRAGSRGYAAVRITQLVRQQAQKVVLLFRLIAQ